MTGRWGAAARLCSALAIAVGLLSAPAGARAAGDAVTPSAVIVMYHRFGESALPSTNIRLDQFAAHLAELTSGGYNVMPLP